MVAALLGTGQVEVITQEVQQGGPRSEFELSFDAVDAYPNRQFSRYLHRVPLQSAV
jgi:hypothetical protein